MLTFAALCLEVVVVLRPDDVQDESAKSSEDEHRRQEGEEVCCSAGTNAIGLVRNQENDRSEDGEDEDSDADEQEDHGDHRVVGEGPVLLVLVDVAVCLLGLALGQTGTNVAGGCHDAGSEGDASSVLAGLESLVVVLRHALEGDFE